ncbi:MAG TPA: hypothetical protein VMT30_06550 [Candidatus Saccharimonadia bacterium]|nr:hypothetical protein [Candidatus Saccharimonadia bacterium]
MPVQSAQTVPYMVNFQGRLTDNSGNILSDGLYNVKFRLWTLASGGTNAWEADRVRGASDHRIQITNGLFNIQFGDTTLGDPALGPTLFSSGTYPLYLEVELPTPATATCSTNGCASFTEGAMTPRQPLASTPYAFSADTLDGLDSAAFGQLSASNTFTSANIFSPSSGVAITIKPAAATHSLDVKDSSNVIQAYFDASGILNVGQTIQATTSTVDLGTSGSTFRTGYFGTSVQTPTLNAATSGATITTNAGTLQRTSSGGLTIDLKDAGATTLTVTNSGGGVAGISATGGLTIGTGRVITVGATAGTGVTCSSGQILDAITVAGGVVTGGSCIAAGGGDKFLAAWTSQQATTATNTQTTVQFTGAANSAPSFNNGTHVLTLPSNASRLLIESKAGGGGGGSVGTTSAVKAAGGGGEGGLSQLFVGGSLAANYYFKVGGGGAGGASGGTNTGTTGSSSCLGTNSGDACTTPAVNAVGGTGGTGVTTAVPATGGAGGAAGSGAGDVKLSGAPGCTSTATATTAIVSGCGGGQGGGASQAGAAAAANGIAGTSGGGGSGGIQGTAAVTSRAGGNGGDGYVKISVYVTVAGTGNPATLQSAYDNATNPEITLSGNGLTVRDSSGGLGSNLFEVQDNAGATTYLGVTTSGITTSGTVTASTTGTINGLSVSAGALSGITGYTQASGTFSQTYATATAGTSGQVLGFSNTNAGAGVTVQGTKITPSNATPGSGTNTLNVLDFAAGNSLGAGALTNGINFESATGYTAFINTPTYKLESDGDQTAAFTALDGTSTANGAGTNATTLILTSAANFDIGNYVQVNSANCGGTGVNPCYAKITAKATNTLTITPALTWANAAVVNEYHLPEIGGTDTAQTLAGRYGRGYFIAGVATGNGTTYYNEDSIDSSLTSFNLLTSNVTTLNIGTAATTLAIGSASTSVSVPGTFTVAGQSIVNGSGQINGAQIQSGTIANAALASPSLTVAAGTGLSGGGSVALGAGTSLAVVYGSSSTSAVRGDTALTCPSGSGNLSGGGTAITLGTGGTCGAITISNAPTFTTSVTSPTINATSGFQANGTPAVGSTCGAGAAITGATFTTGILTSAGTCTTFQTAGSYLVQAPASSAANTVTAPTGVVGLSVKGTTGTAAHLLDVYNSAVSPTVQSFFDLNGAFNTAQAIVAPTSTNSINGLVINAGALTSVGNITGAGAVTLQSAAATALTIDSGTTGAINIGTGTTSAKTITIGPSATNTNATTYNLGVNTAGTQDINIGSAGSGDAAAGTTVSIQAGTTAGTALMLGTNGAGGITIDSGTTGAINIGTGANAKTLTLGNTTTTAVTNILGGATGAINIGTVGSAATASAVHVADTSGNAVQGVTIGSIGSTSSATTLQAGGTLTLKGASSSATAVQIQTAAGTNLLVFDTSASRLTVGVVDGTGTLLVFDSKNTTGDPTGVGGGEYYNSNNNKFRCFQNSVWQDCISHTVLRLAADVINNNATANTMADVTGLTWSVTSGTLYTFSCTISYTAAATTTGSRWSINGPATPTALFYKSQYSLTTTTYTTNDPVNAYDSPAASSASSAAITGNNIATVSGFIRPSANGTVALRFASEVSSSAITAKAGSTCEYW